MLTGESVNSDQVTEDTQSIINNIIKSDRTDASDISIVENSIFTWKNNSELLFAAKDIKEKSCEIYTYSNGRLENLYSYAPCQFTSIEKNQRKGVKNPDIIYIVRLSDPSQVGPTEAFITLVYDDNLKTYCKSEKASAWYQTGNRMLTPILDDLICIGEPD